MCRTVSVHAESKDTFDHLRGFIIHDPLRGVIRIFHISVGWYGGQMLTGFAFQLQGCPYLFAAVFNIELVYDIQKGFINGKPITNNPYVFYQSTITNDALNKALDDLKNNYEKIKVYKCSCPQCKLRQNILSAEINEKTFLILVGSKTSSNTNSLLEIYQKNTKSNNFIIVNSLDEITKLEINPEFDYLITSGTSTPNKTVLDIFKYLRSL